jgi:nitrite reductase (NO-forming)
MMKCIRQTLGLFMVLTFILAGCTTGSIVETTKTEETPVVQKINQPPVEPVIAREGNDVYIEMTAQVTDVEISTGVFYNAWTFNGTVPGPVLVQNPCLLILRMGCMVLSS